MCSQYNEQNMSELFERIVDILKSGTEVDKEQWKQALQTIQEYAEDKIKPLVCY